MRQVRRWIANPRFDDLQEQIYTQATCTKTDYEHLKNMVDSLTDMVRDIKDELNDLRMAYEDLFDLCEQAIKVPKNTSEPKPRGRPPKK